MRVRWTDLEIGAFEARLLRPLAAPPGYTTNTVVTEWLTVNCRGDWASRTSPRFVEARFRERSERDAAVRQFGARLTG